MTAFFTNKKRAGFTLIEILVVLSIISLLSTMAVTQLSSVREKARVVASIQFSDEIFQAIGDNCVGGWDFEEGSGAAVGDHCGLSGSGTVNGATWTNGVTNGSSALEFNGATDYVRVNNIPSLGNRWTLEAWLYPHSVTQNAMFLSKGRVYMRVRDKGVIELRWDEPDGTDVWVLTGNYVLLLNRWNHIVGTHNGAEARIYVNGQIKATLARPSYVVPADWWHIGASDRNERHFDGAIDNVRFYAESMFLP